MLNGCSLDNGIKIIADANQSLHRVDIGFYFKAGSIYESPRNNGITYMTTHMFFRDLNGIEQNELYYRIDSIGAVLKAKVHKDFVSFNISSSPQYLNQTIDLIINVLKDFAWSQSDFEKEYCVIRKKIELNQGLNFSEYVDNCYFLSTKLNLPIMGKLGSLDKLTVNAINIWKKRFFNSNNVCCVLTGNFSNADYEAFKNKLEKVENIAGKPNIESYVLPKQFCKRDDSSDRIVATEWDLSDISVSYDVNTDIVDCYNAELLFSILGQGVGSRLSLLLRDKKALTDEISTKIDTFYNNKRLVLEFTVHNKDLVKALSVVKKEINNLKNTLTDRDLESAKLFFTCNQNYILDSAEEYNHYLGQNSVIGEDNFNLIEEMESFNRCDVKSLRDASEKIFISKNLTVFVTNNPKLCSRSQIKKLLSEWRQPGTQATQGQSGDGSVIGQSVQSGDGSVID